MVAENPRPGSVSRSEFRQHAVSIVLRAPFSVVAAAAVVYGVYGFPFHNGALAIALAAYALLLIFMPLAWLIVLPLFLPIVDLAPWSGRFFFDEFDFLVLTTLATTLWRPSTGWIVLRPDGKQYVAIYLLAISLAISTAMVLSPLPPITINSFSSYLSPYNSLRISKGFLWAFLLAPQIDHAYRTNSRRLMVFAGIGVLASLFAMGIGILWEKGVLVALFDWTSIYGLAQALLDFTGTYRATGLFSSMSTGGTAIDGYLSLTTPMALAIVVVARQPVLRLAACVVFGLGLYSTAMTFSRGLYGALAISVLVLALCLAVRYRKTVTTHPLASLSWILWFVTTTAVLTGTYKLGGYVSVGAAAFAALLGLLTGVIAKQVSKPFGAVILIVVIAVSAYAMDHGMSSSKWTNVPPQFALSFAVVIAIALGIGSGLLGYSTVPENRWVDVLSLTAILAIIWLGTIPAMSGVRMTTRFATTSVDFLTRDSHWHDVVSFTKPDFLHRVFGMGTGSFPRYFYFNKIGQIPLVSYRVEQQDNQSYLTFGPGDYNVIQRINIAPNTRYTFSAAMRSRTGKASIKIRLCEKNLIYSERWIPNCAEKSFRLPQSTTFNSYSFTFDSGSLGIHGILSWPVTLLLQNRVPQNRANKSVIDIRSIVLTGPSGVNLVANGNFDHGMDRWLFASDFEHLAWHTKNTFLHVFFEQGLFGLAAYVLLFLLAIARCIRSLKTNSPVPIVLLPAIIAFMATGMFGTVIDNPRVATLLYLTLFIAAFPHDRKYLKQHAEMAKNSS